MRPPFLSAATIPAPHGFFGRRGGVSKGLYDGLNCRTHGEDDRGHVAENRARVRNALGAEALMSCLQKHTDHANFVEATDENLIGDGLVTMTPGLAIGALSADCGPILLSSADGRIVGACHAGWKGAVTGILDSTVALMREKGANEIRAAIGPCISLKSYEVGESFRAQVLDIDPNAEPFFASGLASEGWLGPDIHFDLPGYIANRLSGLDVGVQAIGLCTYAHREMDETPAYFSYRRNTHEGYAAYGCNISAIRVSST